MAGPKSRIVEQAREYLAANAAESGADVLIQDLIDEVGRFQQWLEMETARRQQAMEALDKVLTRLTFVSTT